MATLSPQVVEENGVFVVALTGGPSGGKSTVQAMLSDVLENHLGYKVYRIPETATILLGCGVLFSELDEEQQFNFQENLLRTMMTIEQTYIDLAKSNFKNHGRKTVVLCDRGTMDPSAYIDRPSWMKILDKLQLREVDIRDSRYDMVVHLVTAADGAEAFYGNENNATRSEGTELARKLDQLVKAAWIGHPHFFLVDNSTGFDKKCHRVIEAVLNRMGHMLVKNFDLAAPFPVVYRDFTVEHRYLNPTPDGSQVRMRKRFDESGTCHYNLTTRRTLADGQRVEERRSINGREYDALKTQTDPTRHPVVKTRRCFLYQNCYYQLDVFQSPNPGLVLMEAYIPEHRVRVDSQSSTMLAAQAGDAANQMVVELQESMKLRSLLPPFVEFDREVTEDPAYSMFLLAKKEEDRGFVSMV
ncbi:hypothetical protein H9P43_005304 [Blastocladiella emersonii ATCC 22665]|nr:hypothetical protein H9P43_005304 [Blastocladiella emersonii ATCC 22665]